MLLLINLFTYLVINTNLHPFHVSVCEVYHNENTNALEISMKIFTDDLELSIQKKGHEEFKLIDVDSESVDKNQLETYLISTFQIKINGKETHLEFLGFEFDNDAILCYLEGKKIKKVDEIEISNSIITEVYEDQINLTHFQYQGEMKSLKTTLDNTNGVIDSSTW